MLFKTEYSYGSFIQGTHAVTTLQSTCSQVTFLAATRL